MSQTQPPPEIPIDNEAELETNVAYLLRRVREYVGELNEVANRLRESRPEWLPAFINEEALFSPIKKGANKLLPDPNSGTIFGELRRAIEEEGLDEEALRGAWYMAKYSFEFQVDLLKRRLSGDYETDEFGADWEFIEAVRPFYAFLYANYFRISTSGLQHVPDYGRAMIVGNRSGELPFDAAMVMTAILSEHPAQRLTRSLLDYRFIGMPFLSGLFEKTGQILANDENGVRLLEADELVAVYPEQRHGAGKLWRAPYRVGHFGRGAFARMALKTAAPIIPVAIISRAETALQFGGSGRLRLLPGMGWLGAIPLPAKWTIQFGAPINTNEFPPDGAANTALVTHLTAYTQSRVQQLIYQQLASSIT